MNKKVILLIFCLLSLMLVSCNKIENKETTNQSSISSEEKTDFDRAIDNISKEFKDIEISKEDIEHKETTQINKINSDRYQGQISQKEAPHGNKIEIGIITNKDTGKKYSFIDLFNISDEFVNLIIDTSNAQLDDTSRQFTSNFDSQEWKIRLENVSKEKAISYFMFNDMEQLEIYFDVPPAYGTYMKVVTLEKTQWLDFVKDKSLF